MWINASFFGCYLVILSIVQMESRYFYLIKIFCVTMTIYLTCIAWQQGARRRLLNRSEPTMV